MEDDLKSLIRTLIEKVDCIQPVVVECRNKIEEHNRKIDDHNRKIDDLSRKIDDLGSHLGRLEAAQSQAASAALDRVPPLGLSRLRYPARLGCLLRSRR